MKSQKSMKIGDWTEILILCYCIIKVFYLKLVGVEKIEDSKKVSRWDYFRF